MVMGSPGLLAWFRQRREHLPAICEGDRQSGAGSEQDAEMSPSADREAPEEIKEGGLQTEAIITQRGSRGITTSAGRQK